MPRFNPVYTVMPAITRVLTTGETRTNTTTLADTALTVSLGQGTWRVLVEMIGRISGDIKYNLVGTGGIALVAYGLAANAASTILPFASDALQTGGTTIGPKTFSSNGDSCFITIDAIYTVASSAVFVVQIAQSTASAGIITINPGSFIQAEKLA